MNLISVALWILYIVIILAILPKTEGYGQDLGDLDSQQYERELHSRMKRAIITPVQELSYTSSKVFPKQIALMNSSARIGVVINVFGENVAILNGHTGKGVVIDKALGMGVVVARSGWQLPGQDLESYLPDVNVSSLMEKNYEYSFNLEDNEVTKLAVMAKEEIRRCLSVFGEELVTLLAESSATFFVVLKNLFGSIIHALKNVLGPVLNIAANGWVLIKCGIMAFMTIFLWFGKLIAYVPGGVALLLASLVAFPLVAILTALNGAKAFFYILKELALKFDLMAILRPVLSIPYKIASFIAGLGGAIEHGITGIFNILACLFQLKIGVIAATIGTFMKILLGFFGSKRPKIHVVRHSTNELLTLVPLQQHTYTTEFQVYKSFLSSVGGSGDYSVNGVGVGHLVNLLTDEKSNGTNQVVGILDALKPVLPFKRAVPQLLVGMVKMLNTSDGASKIENIIPSVKVQKMALNNVNNNLLGAALRSASPDDHSLKDLKNLPASELLKRLPVVSAIYKELDMAVQHYDNVTLDELLMNDSVADELVEVTTLALEMPVS